MQKLSEHSESSPTPSKPPTSLSQEGSATDDPQQEPIKPKSGPQLRKPVRFHGFDLDNLPPDAALMGMDEMNALGRMNQANQLKVFLNGKVPGNPPSGKTVIMLDLEESFSDGVRLR